MTSNFAPKSQQALALALAEAQHQHSSFLGTPHLFIALTKLDGDTAVAIIARGEWGIRRRIMTKVITVAGIVQGWASNIAWPPVPTPIPPLKRSTSSATR